MPPTETTASAYASGPLRVSKRNPRYFEDADGRIVWLTGSHTWASLGDFGPSDPPPTFDYDRYLAFLQRHNHNFFRLWTMAHFVNRFGRMDEALWLFSPLPWARTGPGLAADGKPKFDLTKFDPDYFARMRERVSAAGRTGMYVSIMLFEGNGVHCTPPPWHWQGHVFHPQNNINNINGDPKGEGAGYSVHRLDVPEITRMQENYVRKVIDTVNDLDNVLFEIANECGGYSTQWQYHMIRFIHEYEKAKPKQHPVGMTYAWSAKNCGTDEDLFSSEAEWISPGGQAYFNELPAADGKKVVIIDSDHLAGGTQARVPWVWKAFCRGQNVLLMDIEDDMPNPWLPPAPWRDPVRRTMGFARMYASRMNLAGAMPCGDLASSGYCLSDRRNEFLIFAPGGIGVTLNLSDAPGLFDAEWLDAAGGKARPVGAVNGGTRVDLPCPFPGEAVVYLRKRGV